MVVAILLVVFVVVMLLNSPIAFAMGVAAIAAIVVQGSLPMTLITHRLMVSTDSFVMLAIPLFVLAGTLMEATGIAMRLVRLAVAMVGFIRGGLGLSVIVGEMLFSGISGSTTADVSAMSSMLLPSMKRAGYPQEYSVAIVSAASAMGILVPPCITMVAFGGLTNTSVTALFLAGFLPATVLAIMIGVQVYVQAGRYRLPTAGSFSLRELGRAMLDSLIALGMPIIIFGGLIGGVATPTEIGSFAVVYALVVGMLVYRELSPARLWKVLADSAMVSGMILLLVGLSTIFSYLLLTERLDKQLASVVLGISNNPTVFLIITSFLVMVVSAVIEVFPAGLVFIPIFLPIAESLGIDKVHFLTLIVAAGGLGMFVPPSGVGLLIACAVGDIPVHRTFRTMTPFVVVLFAGIIILSAFPVVTTILPSLVLRR